MPSAGVLEVEFVLVRPEPRNLVVGLGSSRHHAPDSKALPLGGLEVLDPNLTPTQRAEEAGHAPRGINPGRRGPSRAVTHNAAIALQSLAFSESEPRD